MDCTQNRRKLLSSELRFMLCVTHFASRVSRWEPVLLALILVLLLFPNPHTGWGYGLLVLTWLCRRLAYGHFTVRTPGDGAMLLLLLLVPISLWASANIPVSLVALGQLMAGVATFYTLVNWACPGRFGFACGKPDRRACSLRRLGWATGALTAGGAVLALVSPVFVPRSLVSLPLLAQVYGRFTPPFRETFNANVVAGTLALLAPLGLAIGLLAPLGGLTPLLAGVARGLSLVAVAVMVTCIFLLGSRGALAAVVVGVLLIGLCRSRWALLSWLLAVVGSGILIWQQGLDRLLFAAGDPLGGVAVRLEVWSRALYMIQDFPFTGIGLGTFPQVAAVLYPFFLIPPHAKVPHAHNLFLQVAVDLGLPGLVAYLALWLGCLVVAWRAYLTARRKEKAALAAGLGTSLAVMGLHGLVDAVTWGTRPAVVAWAIMGMAAALGASPEVVHGRRSEDPDRGR